MTATCGQPERDNQALVTSIEEAEKFLWRALAKLSTISRNDYPRRMTDANNFIRRALWSLEGKVLPAKTGTREERLANIGRLEKLLNAELADLKAQRERLGGEEA